MRWVARFFWFVIDTTLYITNPLYHWLSDIFDPGLDWFEDGVQVGWDRCRKCEADLNVDIEVGRTTCYKCGARIKKSQIKRWNFLNPKP